MVRHVVWGSVTGNDDHHPRAGHGRVVFVHYAKASSRQRFISFAVGTIRMPQLGQCVAATGRWGFMFAFYRTISETERLRVPTRYGGLKSPDPERARARRQLRSAAGTVRFVERDVPDTSVFLAISVARLRQRRALHRETYLQR
jgi:hypothetical protein